MADNLERSHEWKKEGETLTKDITSLIKLKKVKQVGLKCCSGNLLIVIEMILLFYLELR